jgi:hypothetical protein
LQGAPRQNVIDIATDQVVDRMKDRGDATLQYFFSARRKRSVVDPIFLTLVANSRVNHAAICKAEKREHHVLAGSTPLRSVVCR